MALSIVRVDVLTPLCFCSFVLLVILISGLVMIGEFLVLVNSWEIIGSICFLEFHAPFFWCAVVLGSGI